MNQPPTDVNSTTAHRPLRILCLDGGGIKGYTSLLILKRLFREIAITSKSSDEHGPKPCEVFDLIVGTSTGGLIATMLGRLEFSIQECLEQYPTIGKKIFPKKRSSVSKLIRGLVNAPFYDVETMKNEIKSLVTEEVKKRPYLKDVKFCGTDQEQPKSKVLLCVTRTTTRQPDVLRSYKTQATTEENYDCDIWEATSATAAAPIYFAPVKFERGVEKWSDGGLKRNNPINEACNEIARHKEFKAREIGCIVSIGTGLPKGSAISSNLAVFLKQAAAMMTDSEETADAFAASELGLKLAESKRYFRFNVEQGLQEFELDELSKMEKLDAHTKAYLRKQHCAQAITDCAESLVNPERRCQKLEETRFKLLYATNCYNFCPRPSYAQTIASFFASTAARQRFVLWGTGGMGKTQLALEYAQIRARNDHVFWIRCEQYASTLQDLVKLTAVLDPEKRLVWDGSNDEVILRESRRMLDRLDHFLLVLDNADNLDEFTGAAPEMKSLIPFLPEKGDILITTRDPRFLGGLVPADQGTRVTVFEREEARTLLVQSVPQHLKSQMQEPDLNYLLDQLGDLPLAICQAAANIRELQLDLPAYIRAYADEKDRTTVMRAPFLDHATEDERNRLQSIHVAWQLSFAFLKRHHPWSALVLQVMSLLHWSAIPMQFFLQLYKFENLTTIEFRAIMSKLLHLSLVDETLRDEGLVEYSLHPIVHEMIFQWILTTEPSGIEGACEMIVKSLLDNFSPSETNMEAGSYILMIYLMPHAIRALEVSRLCQFANSGIVVLTQNIATLMNTIQLSEAAANLSTQAVNLSLRVWLPDDIAVLYVRESAVVCLIADARYAAAEAMICEYLHMLDYRKVIESLNHSELLRRKALILELYASALVAQDRRDELDGVYRDMIKAAENAGFEKHTLGTMYHKLADNLCCQSRFADARIFEDKAFDAFKADRDTCTEVLAGYTSEVLDIRAAALNIAEHGSDDPVGEAQFVQKMEDHAVRAYTYYRDNNEIYELEFWRAASHLIDVYITVNRLNDATKISFEILEVVYGSGIIIQGQLLEVLSHLVSQVLHVLTPFSKTIPPSTKVVRLLNKLQTFLHQQELGTKDLNINDASVALASAVRLQHLGHLSEAEELSLTVLASSDLEAANLGGMPYYNLMLLRAQQPGRLTEAYEYRERHFSLIEPEETIYGTLHQRVERWKAERQIYDEAKQKIGSGDLEWNAQWCQDHKDQLIDAQRRWGWLFTESNPERALYDDD